MKFKKGLTKNNPFDIIKIQTREEIKKMTIRDLYNWAVANGIEDFEIQIQYRDDGGYYSGTDSCEQSDIEIDAIHNEVIL